MNKGMIEWSTLMAVTERSRARDAFEGTLNQELEDNVQAILRGEQPLLTDQEVESRAENDRAHADFSELLPSELKRISRLATAPRFPTGCGKTAFDVVLTKIKEITDGEEEDLVAKFNKHTILGRMRTQEELEMDLNTWQKVQRDNMGSQD